MVSGNLTVGNEQLSDDSKVCRFCFGEGLDESDWLRPCKCSGSMLWVHRQCFNTWLQKASGNGKVRCEICKFIYKKVWLLKSWEEWCFPKVRLSLVDVLELFFDAFIVYRMKCVNTVSRRSSLLSRILRTSYFLHRLSFYVRVFCAVGSSFFDVLIIDAV